jgi:ribonuclease HII
VVAAAVVVAPGFFIPEVDDSKTLSCVQREILYEQIVAGAVAVGVGSVDHDTIDEINILNATFRAMNLAIHRLPVTPGHVLIDGNRFAREENSATLAALPFTTIVDGDALCFSIAAASIVAKVTRDRMMIDFDREFPGYGFARHKGYATREHREAITRLGLCAIHRRTFRLYPQLELEL